MLPALNLSRSKPWIRVVTLCFAAFTFNSTEYMPVGILSQISESFDLGVTQAGLLMTVYACTVACISLPITLLTARINRKTLLIILLVIFVVGHALSFFSENFDTLVLSRVVVAIAHSLFWSISVSMAVGFAPQGKKSKSLGMLAASTGLAAVIGIPSGRMIGQVYGWQVPFMMIGAIGIIILSLVIKYIPNTKIEYKQDFKSLALLLSNSQLIYIYIFCILVVTAHFSVFTYVEPLYQRFVGGDSKISTLLLFVMGVAGMSGGVIFSRREERSIKGTLFMATITLSFCLFTLSFTTMGFSKLIFFAFLWSLSFMMIGMSMQMIILNLSGDAADLAMATQSSVVNLAIGAGSYFGNELTKCYGLSSLGVSGAILSFIALVFIMVATGQHRYFLFKLKIMIRKCNVKM